MTDTGGQSRDTAASLSGVGTFTFDNSDALTTESSCPMEKSVWFTWVAPTTGIYHLSTCGLTQVRWILFI